LGGSFPLTNDAQCMDAVQSQIQILREAWRNGAGSYFAYRMGGLASLTSELLIPYGMVYTEVDRKIESQIEEFLETNVAEFSFNVNHPYFQYILSTRLYLEKARGFHDSDVMMIADDFRRGIGVRGMLAQAGPKYFERAIHSTVDVWYTVLRLDGEVTDEAPSREQMALYYIEEVKYLLAVHRNMQFASRSFDLFEKYNPAGMKMAYVTLGDAFYAFGTDEGKLRAVKEWDRAYDVPGETRHAASARLSKHYLEKGEALFKNAQGPTAEETDLSDALLAFNDALRYDRESDVAASRIRETTDAITLRRERYQLQETFIANALTAMQSAERSAVGADFSGAITSYNQASMLLTQVTEDFKDLNKRARETASEINKNVKTVISNVFASANESIEKGDSALASNNVDEAVRFYSMVESIVGVVPSEEGSINAQKKQDMIAAAQSHIDEAELQRRRLEQQQQNPAPASGAKPGAATPKPHAP
jgi:hypothetical protein